MNLKQLLVSGVIISAVGVGAAFAQDATPAGTMEPLMNQVGATAMLQDANGSSIGQVTLSERSDGKVVIVANVNGLTPGFVGFHIHETGQCDASTEMPFTSAGGHYNPAGVDHPDHAGDLPSLLIGADGTGELMVVTDRFAMADLMDSDGSAVVIHSSDDNFANIPERYGQPDADTLKAGDSGTRVACGVIQQDAEATVG